MIPRISETTKIRRLSKKVKPTHSVLGLSTRGEVMAIKAGMVSARPQRVQTNDAIAILLILTVTGCLGSEVSVIEALQN